MKLPSCAALVKSCWKFAAPCETNHTSMILAPVSLPLSGTAGGVWKIRVSSTAEGQWSLVTTSDVKELDGQHATFQCVKNTNPHVHGVLRVDREHPHHFTFDDGTRFFMQGYEYDWLWALDMDKPNVPTVEKSLDILSRHGFNYVILNSYAHDTGWCKGKTSDDDYGPPLLYAWKGSNDQPDHSRMNLAFWRHYDRVMATLAQRGMQAHMLIKVYNKSVKWPARGSDEEKLFFRWLVARYAAYPNVIWDFSKEAHNEKDLAYKQGWMKWLRENDPYRHLVTVHDDDKVNDEGAYDDLTDYPPRLALKGTEHEWETDLAGYFEKYGHPLWKQHKKQAKKSGGHGGMDYLMNWRLIHCLRSGSRLDMTVYDTAAWSSVFPFSVASVAQGSSPVRVPDFTRRQWKTPRPLLAAAEA